MNFHKMLSWLVVMLIALVLVSGCGGDNAAKDMKKDNTYQPSSSKEVTDPIFRDKKLIEAFNKDVKDKFGADFKVFRSTFGGNIHFLEKKITFSAVDPKNTKNVDGYTWVAGSGFEKTVPVKVTQTGGNKVEDFADYQTSMGMVNFLALPTFIEEVDKVIKEKGVECPKPVNSVFVELEGRNSERRVFNTTVQGARENWRFYGDAETGKIIKSEKAN